MVPRLGRSDRWGCAIFLLYILGGLDLTSSAESDPSETTTILEATTTAIRTTYSPPTATTGLVTDSTDATATGTANDWTTIGVTAGSSINTIDMTSSPLTTEPGTDFETDASIPNVNTSTSVDTTNMTSSPLTTGPVTTDFGTDTSIPTVAPSTSVNTTDTTSGPLTTEPVTDFSTDTQTTSVMTTDMTTSPLTTGPVTTDFGTDTSIPTVAPSTSVNTTDTTSGPLTTEPVTDFSTDTQTTSVMTTDMTNSPLTTGPVTTDFGTDTSIPTVAPSTSVNTTDMTSGPPTTEPITDVGTNTPSPSGTHHPPTTTMTNQSSSTPAVTTRTTEPTSGPTEPKTSSTTTPRYPSSSLADIDDEDAQKLIVIEIKVTSEFKNCDPADDSTCENFKNFFKNQVTPLYEQIQGFDHIEIGILRSGSIIVPHTVVYKYKDMEDEERDLPADQVYSKTTKDGVEAGTLGTMEVRECEECTHPQDETDLCGFADPSLCEILHQNPRCEHGYLYCVSPCTDQSYCTSVEHGTCLQISGHPAECKCESDGGGHYYGDSCEKYFNQRGMIIGIAVCGGFVFGIIVAITISRWRKRRRLGGYRQYYMDDGVSEEGYLWNASYTLDTGDDVADNSKLEFAYSRGGSDY